MTALAVSFDDVQAAAVRLHGRVLRTPLVPLHGLGLRGKLESLQPIGAFKQRGATNAVLALAPAGVVTASSGNHGQAVAAAALAAGIPAVVVMPDNATGYKRAAVERLGAEVVVSPPETGERNAMAAALASSRGLTLIPAYDHPLVIAGQGTCGLEIAADAADAEVVVVPLGGGGLLSGVATALRGEAATRSARIIGVEPGDGDDWMRSRAAGRRVQIPAPTTICDGARNTIPGELTWPIVTALVDDVVTVSDGLVVDAMRALAGCGLVVEPTGALAVAAALEHHLAGAVCVITGRNIDPRKHARLVAGA